MARRIRPRRRGAVALVAMIALMGLIGCTLDPQGSRYEDSAPAPAPAPSQPRGDGSSCDESVLAAATASVTGQLAAFARRDFPTALSFASTSFRAGMDLAAFQRLIETSYPEVASPTQHVVLACARPDDSSVQLLVSVTGGAGTTDELVYLLVDEGGRWGIAAAASRGRTGSLA